MQADGDLELDQGAVAGEPNDVDAGLCYLELHVHRHVGSRRLAERVGDGSEDLRSLCEHVARRPYGFH